MAKHAERRQDAVAANDEDLGEAHALLMSLPRVRMLRRANKSGGTTIYYAWDGRSCGHDYRMIGKDPEKALEKYREHEAGIVRPARPHRRFDYGPEHATLPAWAKACFVNARHRARALGREFGLTTESFVALVDAADGCCQLSGLPFDKTVPDDARANPFTPSIDRIDSTKGYVEGNCRIVCLMANILMGTWGDGPLFQFAEGVCRKNGLLGGRDAKLVAEKTEKRPLKSKA